MSAGGTADNVVIGPGRLWVAPVGTTAPTSASAALDPAFWAVGYTEEGTTVSIELTTEEIMVAEELDPIRYVNSARSTTIALAMAEMSRKRLALASGLGGGYVDSAAALDALDVATEENTPVMLVWDSEETAAGNDQNRRWVFYSAYQTGAVSVSRQKAPAKSTLPVEFKAAKTTGNPLYRAFPNADGLV